MHRPSQVDAKRSEAALAIWQATAPVDGTRVDTYLASRELYIAPPPTLRSHAGLKHPSGGTWPAMVAQVTRGSDDTPLAIHRTFLARDGVGKAPVDPSRMMLGPCRGGAVRLGAPGEVLMVGEGFETCLAAMPATGHPAWAALSPRGGDAMADACASLVHLRGWISTICLLVARPHRGGRAMSSENPMRGDELIAAAINEAEELDARGETAPKAPKPRLPVDICNPDRTLAALRDILADAGTLYDRGVPVRVFYDKPQRGVVAQGMTPDGIILQAHSVCRPFRLKKNEDGTLSAVDAALPRSIATMYLDWRGEWNLPLLNGIASAPLLQENGMISSAEGHDTASGMWRESVPDLSGFVPERPTKDEAAAGLQLIREEFQTFCFADAETITTDEGMVVDTRKPPGVDEFSFLAALLTAVCRPSLHLSPGVVVRAPSMSGGGAGKGLLARCICTVAFGRQPHAVTGGATAEELEKRIASELIGGGPVLFIDNLNGTALKSDLLASAITERPARVRILGRSQMVPLNASAFVVLTGNGLTVSEDLARPFITVDLDPRTEEPEARKFKNDILRHVAERRMELLAALLTIWRWGRSADDIIQEGRPLGSFST